MNAHELKQMTRSEKPIQDQTWEELLFSYHVDYLYADWATGDFDPVLDILAEVEIRLENIRESAFEEGYSWGFDEGYEADKE
jgi:hypothetical protein